MSIHCKNLCIRSIQIVRHNNWKLYEQNEKREKKKLSSMEKNLT